MSSVRTLLVISACLVGMSLITTGQPVDHMEAYCKVVWLFGYPCAQVNKTILTQMKSMEQYKLGTVNADLIEATHTSVGGQIQMLNFTLLEAAMDMGCRVGGSSMSDYWLSLLDNGTNYCNLQNVIKGSGLINAPGYTEYTNEWVCLGYGLASCKV
ncbi:unnamed protein product [Boreogadus saida]